MFDSNFLDFRHSLHLLDPICTISVKTRLQFNTESKLTVCTLEKQTLVIIIIYWDTF